MRAADPTARPATCFVSLLLAYALIFSFFAPSFSRPAAAAASVSSTGATSRSKVETTKPASGPAENLPYPESRKQNLFEPRATRPVTNAASPKMMTPQHNPINDPDFSTARLRPENETGTPGVDLGSRNFNWSLPVLELPGRAGLDLSLTLYYNSLVWTKQLTNTKFTFNRGFPSWNGAPRAPGFAFHFPYLEQRYQNQDHDGYAYMVITPSGSRIELRQVGTSNVYEAADSSYAQLVDNGTAGAVLRMSNGMIYTFGFNETTTNPWGQPIIKGRRCTQIKDRNGNFISATHNTNGGITTITDTLGRVINFNYNTTTNLLTSITQTRNGATFTWATFTYGTVAYSVNFVPPDSGNNSNGASVQVLTQINLADGSYHAFAYNTYAQVYRITHYAPDGHTLAYVNYNLPLDNSVQQSDCPRFTEQRVWAENWNNNQEVATNFAAAGDGSWSQVTLPDNTPADPNDNVVHKEYFATTGWQKGMLTRTEMFLAGSPSTLLKWTTNTWTQDDEGLTYQKNPRITETNVYDAQGNRRRVTVDYGSYAQWGLPYLVKEYAADGTTEIRHTFTDYNLSQAYLDRRIIGLVSARQVSDTATWQTITYFAYDAGGDQLAAAPTTIQHDAAYDANFLVGRGNLTSITRYDVYDINNPAKRSVMAKGYNTNGSTAFVRDPLNHQTNLIYSDDFSEVSKNGDKFAYPTRTVDADGFEALVQYNYDTGNTTRKQTPLPNSTTNQPGPIVTYSYDSIGRLDRIDNLTNGAYTRWVYPASQTYLRSFTKLNSASPDEYSSEEQFDGLGRVRLTAAQFPGSAGGNRVTRVEYDVMGRVAKRSNPMEADANWNPAGDDAATGLQWTQQAYDWNGRPTLTTNPDGTTTEATYGGCGCAGGETVTTRDERSRRTRLTKDVVGRLKRAEELNWDQSVYSTTEYTYNARDQITSINQQGQVRSFEFDGHGRLWKRTTPEQGLTTYAYNADDTTQSITDARGATTTLGYNNRHLVTSTTYGVPAGVAATANLSFGYDAAGNRISMTDGLGSVAYHYDAMSRMDWEDRTFSGLGTYRLSYAYAVGGQQKNRITGPSQFGSTYVDYGYNKAGSTTSVSSSGYGGVSNYASSVSYRAFGSIKQVTNGNNTTLSLSYDNRLRASQWLVAGVMGWNYAYTTPLIPENTGRVAFADNVYDATLDRSYDYDQVGRLGAAHTGVEANGHAGYSGGGAPNGPYAQNYSYDQWGNGVWRNGWGAVNSQYTYNPQFVNNKMTVNPITGAGVLYDAAGNLSNDGQQTYTYDATGQQATASSTGLSQAYDGDGMRVRKTESGATTYYLRSSIMGKQVLVEINSDGSFKRGYIYLGGQLLALQQNNQVSWVHQDPVTKSQRLTNSSGAVISWVDLDPWGGETGRSNNSQAQPHRYTTYERDNNGSDEAMMRRYEGKWRSFAQPDPFDGSYDLTKPQSLNRYAYVQNDPVNFYDPSGLCIFNINITGASGQTLTDMQNEMRRIFASGNHQVFFGVPGLANGGSMNIGIVGQYTGAAANVITSQGLSANSPGILGVTVPNSGNGYVNSTNIYTANAPWRFSTRPASTGAQYGRVGAHEAIQHGFLGTGPDGTERDITLPAGASLLVSPTTSRFDISATTAAALANLCLTPIPVTAPVINTNPIPLRPLQPSLTRPGVPQRNEFNPGGGISGWDSFQRNAGILGLLGTPFRGYTEVLGYRLNPPR